MTGSVLCVVISSRQILMGRNVRSSAIFAQVLQYFKVFVCDDALFYTMVKVYIYILCFFKWLRYFIFGKFTSNKIFVKLLFGR